MKRAILALAAIAASPVPAERELTANEKQVVGAAVARLLRDPGSAQFEWWPVRDSYVLCGTVNGKNGYGGYAGAQVFIIYMERVDPAVIPDPHARPHILSGDDYMTRTYREQCTRLYRDRIL